MREGERSMRWGGGMREGERSMRWGGGMRALTQEHAQRNEGGGGEYQQGNITGCKETSSDTHLLGSFSAPLYRLIPLVQHEEGGGGLSLPQ